MNTSSRNVNVYVLQNGKYVVKKKLEHELFVTPCRSQQSEPIEQSKKEQDEAALSDASSRPNGELTNSAIFPSKHEYRPKHFISHKASVKHDFAEFSPCAARIEQTSVYHTPTRNSIRQFQLLPLDTLSKNSDEAYYTSRQERSDHGIHIENYKDKEIVILNKRISDLNEANKDLTSELKACKLRLTEYDSKNYADLQWYQQALQDRAHQVSILKEENDLIKRTYLELNDKNKLLEKVHNQLCLEILFLRGQVIDKKDIITFFTQVKHSQRKLTQDLEMQLQSIKNQVRQLEFSNTQASIIESLVNQLKREEMFLNSYRNGLAKKQQIQKIISSFLQKERIQRLLVKQLSDEVSMFGEIVEDLTSLLHECLLMQNKNQEEFNFIAKKINLTLMNSQLAQAQARKQTLRLKVQEQKIEIDLKKLQANLVKNANENIRADCIISSSGSSTPRCGYEFFSIQDTIIKLESQAKTKQIQIDRLRYELQQTGMENSETKPSPTFPAEKHPPTFSSNQQYLKIIRQVSYTQHKRFLQIRRKTNRLFFGEYHFDQAKQPMNKHERYRLAEYYLPLLCREFIKIMGCNRSRCSTSVAQSLACFQLQQQNQV